jgi:secondary thiamine-phosphate synthase enzyme
VTIRIPVVTTSRCELADITDAVADAATRLGLHTGSLLVFVPHTTAAVTINEGYDPAVANDLLRRLAALAPPAVDSGGGADTHAEGNSDSHLKAVLVGASTLLDVRDGTLTLGRWQRVFFCEFDGPRQRHVLVSRV